MTSKKRKPSSAVRQRIARLERELATVEAEIAQLEQNKRLSGSAEDDHFALRRRATLFMSKRSEGWH
jgi:hypothetical protein